MDLLGFMVVNSGIYYYLIMYLIKLVIRSNILQVKEVALRIVLIIILEKSIDSYNSVPTEKNIDFS